MRKVFVLMLAVLMVMSVVALAVSQLSTSVNLNQGPNFVPGSASGWSGATTTNVSIQVYQWVQYEVFPVSNVITQPGVQTLKLANLGVYSNGGLSITFNLGTPTPTYILSSGSFFWWMANNGGINPTVTATYTGSDGTNSNSLNPTVSSGPLTLTTSPVRYLTSLPNSVGPNLTLGLTQNVPPDANAGGFYVPVTVVISTTVTF